MLHFWHLVNLCNFLSVALCRLGKRKAHVCSLYMTTKKTSIPDEKSEAYVCNLYMTTKKTSILDELCYLMFCQNKQKNEMLPSTTDWLLQHLEHLYNQAFGWSRALEAMQDLGSPEGHGWMRDGELLILLPITNAPAPVSLLELMTCKYKTSTCQQNCPAATQDLLAQKCTSAWQTSTPTTPRHPRPHGLTFVSDSEESDEERSFVEEL